MPSKAGRNSMYLIIEKPIGIQIFGGDEDAMAMSARIVDAVQPDLLDINFGCPVKKVVNKGAGAGVLKDVPLMVAYTQHALNQPVCRYC
jgi:tRNA-dihydrouridine synthase